MVAEPRTLLVAPTRRRLLRLPHSRWSGSRCRRARRACPRSWSRSGAQSWQLVEEASEVREDKGAETSSRRLVVASAGGRCTALVRRVSPFLLSLRLQQRQQGQGEQWMQCRLTLRLAAARATRVTLARLPLRLLRSLRSSQRAASPLLASTTRRRRRASPSGPPMRTRRTGCA